MNLIRVWKPWSPNAWGTSQCLIIHSKPNTYSFIWTFVFPRSACKILVSVYLLLYNWRTEKISVTYSVGQLQDYMSICFDFHLVTTAIFYLRASLIFLLALEFSSVVCTYEHGFGGLVVSMLASGTQVCGFKPGRSRWVFTEVKILSMPSSRGEVKESVPCPSFVACKRT